jgi:3'-phosphoadenosine 5'-phosphosulfate sulfotransferase (PAPS reductase)/FAD synthetase
MTTISYPACFALVSGGKDSLSTAQVLHDAGKLAGCVALDTGISTPDWKQFLLKTCASRGWDLEFYRTDESYEDLVHRFGFPGPGKHGMFMNFLKGRCIRKFKKTWPDAVLASGVREGESSRRWVNTKPLSVWEGVPILAPIYNWSTDATWDFFNSHGFERAPAYDFMTVSGDCLCGAFAQQGEAAALRLGYPDVADWLDALGAEIRDKHPDRCKWGWGCQQDRKKSSREAAICVECGDTEPFASFEFEPA